MATASTSQYAAGDMSHYLALGEESRKISGKRRRTVYSSAHRPLFVAEADFRATKVFTRVKKGMLALYGTDLHVVDVLGLEAADVASGLADVTSHVLRWVNYVDILDVSFAGPATLRIEHGDTSDKPKVRGVGDPFAAAIEDDTSAHSGHAGPSMGGVSAVSTSSAAAASSATIRVTSDSFTLTFRDAGIAQQAAAALLFQQAQYSAMQHWLRVGLHAGFRCDLISVSALPLMYDDNPFGGSSGGRDLLMRSHSFLPPHVLYSAASGSYSARGSGGGAAAAAAVAGAPASSIAAASALAAGAAAVPYPWGDTAAAGAQEWGCLVALPASWGSVLDAAASSSGAAVGDEERGATPEELTCPVVLEHGPKALQVMISTPLGAAVATLTPQLAKAALLHSCCREILALPLHPHGTSSSAAPMAAFTWNVQGSVATAAGAAAVPEGSTASSGRNSSAPGCDLDDTPTSSAGVWTGSGAVPLMHTLDAFASLTVQVIRTPATANRRGTSRAFNSRASSAEQQAASRHLSSLPEQAGVDSTSSSSSGGQIDWQSNSSLKVQLAVCAVLAALAVTQLAAQPLLLLLQLLLLAAVAGTAIKAAQTTAAPGSSSSSSSSGKSLTCQAGAGQQQACGAGSSEDETCCGWSIMLVSADLCSAPSRHLQLQVSLARASKGMTRLRLRMASLSTGGAALSLPLLGLPSEEEDVELPVLVSDPEPAWVTPDTKQRFINAKPTLEASQEQARRTDKWRQQMDVDKVLSRPCPKFPLMCRLLPTYLLSDDTPEGRCHCADEGGGVKDLCDAIFQTPDDAPEGLSLYESEQTLALLNEYLVKVAAPKPLPAGFQVQIYDLSGFKLSYVMGDMMQLFKLLVRFGLYYPERLRMALVINAPAWFSTPWKAMSVFLDENTSAKVVVVGSPKSALTTLTRHLGGIENVPVAWGGKCTLPFEEYPANKRMMEYGRRLNAGEQPFQSSLERHQQQQQQH